MKKSTFLCALITSACLITTSGASQAADSWIGMVTGSKTGTYIKIGQDISDSARNYGVEIQVKESGGSLDNIKRMNSRENAGFGIVQSDVLGFLQRSNDPDLVKVVDRLRMVFPLYNEEVHIFANKSIQSLSDLNGKTVSVGTDGGGSWMTATNLFGILGVQPAQIHTWDNTQAAAAVIDGNVDAMIYVAGKPVTFFEKVGELAQNPAYAERFNNVHFVPVSELAVKNEYAVSSIGPEDYPWLTQSVEAVAVKAMMVSYDFSSRMNAYFAMRCNQLGQISNALYADIDRLKMSGSTPKWQEVDLSASIGNWKRDTCSEQGSSQPTVPAARGSSTEDALKNALGL